MTALTLAQKLLVWKWLDSTLSALREDDLLPQAGEQMPPGSRIPVMFGRRLAGWISMPRPSQSSARVVSEAQLLAWAQVHYPEKIEHPVEVKVDAGLIEFLQEHRPESLNTGTRVDPQWTADICKALAGQGFYTTLHGEKLTKVPGIKVPEAAPSVPHVYPDEAAGEIIRQVWADGSLDFRELLSLPASEVKPDAA
jgi:hypothetical protein